MEYVERTEWHRHYAEGKGFRLLGDVERKLLATHVPAPEGGGRALEVGCGTGELSVHLTSLDYTVDAVDFADSAIARAREEHPDAPRVRWIRMDVERDDPVALHEGGYDLIVLRLVIPFLANRVSTLHGLGERLRPGGALVVITPVAEHTPEERRGTALDEDEIVLLTGHWERAERFDADRLAVLVLRGPCHGGTRAVERRPAPSGPEAATALAVVTDETGRVLLGRSRRGVWELPGGEGVGSETFAAAAVRGLAEDTGLAAEVEDAHVVTMLGDAVGDVPRLTAVVRITSWTGALSRPEHDGFVRWEFFERSGLRRGRVRTGRAGAGGRLARDPPGPAPGDPVRDRRGTTSSARRACRGRSAPAGHGGDRGRRRLGPVGAGPGGASVGAPPPVRPREEPEDGLRRR
ncbi:methyltransferase [Streptomyces sp. R44]|uniref:Methyltransferase n=1 Tax=Streptomyces sp. R44 TaxID=3238633 RepID=A0AB39TCS2_9ACTN